MTCTTTIWPWRSACHRAGAQALAARARSQLEQALGVMHIALTGRAACPVLEELLADWDGQLTEDTRELVGWHIKECQTCAQHEWGALRPVAFTRLLPSAPLPPDLREQVLNRCTSAAPDAVAYRRRVVRRAAIDLVREVLPRHQARELGQHPGPSRHGGGRRGGSPVGRCGGQRFAARWLPCRTGSDDWSRGHSCPGYPAGRRAPVEWSGGRPAHGDRPRRRQRAAVPSRQPTPRPSASYPVQSQPSPQVPVAPSASTPATPSKSPSAKPSKSAVILGHAVEVAVGYAVEVGVILGHVLGFFVPVADRLSQPSQRRSCLRQAG